MTVINENDIVNVAGGAATTKAFKYTVKSGDCLSNLAKQYNTTVPAICQLNNIKNADYIVVGEVLLIPMD